MHVCRKSVCFWAKVHHRTTCGASSNSHTILFDIMVQLEPQGCYFNTPPPQPPTLPPLFPPSPLLCCWLREFGPLVLIWPHTPGVSVCSFLFLSPSRAPTPLPRLLPLARYRWPVSVPVFIWVIKLNIWKYFLHVLYESKWRKLWGNATFLQLPVQMILFLFWQCL